MISEDIITVQGICNALVSPLISCSDPKKKLSELYDKEVALKRVATISQRTDAIASKAVGEVLQRKSRDLQTGWKSFRTILTAGLDQDEICLEPLQQGAKKMKVLLQELFQITHLPSVIQTAPTSSAPTAFANEELTPEQEWQNYQVQESQEKLSAESPATVLQVKSFTFELVRGRLGKNLQQLAIERSEMLFAQEAFLKLFFLYAIQKKIDFDALVFADQLPDGQFAKIAADLQPYLQEENNQSNNSLEELFLQKKPLPKDMETRLSALVAKARLSNLTFSALLHSVTPLINDAEKIVQALVAQVANSLQAIEAVKNLSPLAASFCYAAFSHQCPADKVREAFQILDCIDTEESYFTQSTYLALCNTHCNTMSIQEKMKWIRANASYVASYSLYCHYAKELYESVKIDEFFEFVTNIQHLDIRSFVLALVAEHLFTKNRADSMKLVSLITQPEIATKWFFQRLYEIVKQEKTSSIIAFIKEIPFNDIRTQCLDLLPHCFYTKIGPDAAIAYLSTQDKYNAILLLAHLVQLLVAREDATVGNFMVDFLKQYPMDLSEVEETLVAFTIQIAEFDFENALTISSFFKKKESVLQVMKSLFEEVKFSELDGSEKLHETASTLFNHAYRAFSASTSAYANDVMQLVAEAACQIRYLHPLSWLLLAEALPTTPDTNAEELKAAQKIFHDRFQQQLPSEALKTATVTQCVTFLNQDLGERCIFLLNSLEK